MSIAPALVDVVAGSVFKDGIGYDSRKLVESVRGQVGIR
jgi:hypothetical protein